MAGASDRAHDERVLFDDRLRHEIAERPGCTIKDLAASLDAPLRRVQRAVCRLLAAGRLIKAGPGGRLFVPRQEEAPIPIRRGLDPSPIDSVLVALPTDEHRSFTRLYLGAAVGRYHLAKHTADGWPCAIAYGPTGAGKTILAVIAAQMLGQKPSSAVRPIGRETSRSLFGRRKPGRGGTSFEPSKYLRGPVLALDELDKCSVGLRQDVLLLLQGDSEMEAEGQRFTMKTSVLATFNAPRLPDWLHEAYRRRGITLNTNGLASRQQVAASARELFSKQLPRLDLSTLRPPIRQVSALDESFLDSLVSPWLTKRGSELWDPRYTSKAALGYVALFKVSLRRALIMVATDYLQCAKTTNEAKDGFREALEPLLQQENAPSPQPPPEEDQDESEEGDGEDTTIGWKDLIRTALDAIEDGIPAGEDKANTEFPYLLDMDGPKEPSIGFDDEEEIGSEIRHLFKIPASFAERRAYTEADIRKVYGAFLPIGEAWGEFTQWYILQHERQKQQAKEQAWREEVDCHHRLRAKEHRCREEEAGRVARLHQTQEKALSKAEHQAELRWARQVLATGDEDAIRSAEQVNYPAIFAARVGTQTQKIFEKFGLWPE